jgi:hypothetical protein
LERWLLDCTDEKREDKTRCYNQLHETEEYSGRKMDLGTTKDLVKYEGNKF